MDAYAFVVGLGAAIACPVCLAFLPSFTSEPIPPYSNNILNPMQSSPPSPFPHPEQLLHSLLSLSVHNCDCTQQPASDLSYNQSTHIQQIQSNILNLQQTLDAMNHEVVEVQNLLTQRDVLYHQLDHLRAEREEIEDDIEGQQVHVQREVKVRGTTGLREMNERLRRRIREVSEYIVKMESENVKIEQAIGISQSPPKTQYMYTEYRGTTWMDRTNPKSPPKDRFNRDYLDGLRKRLQVKQEQAWQRVKRQQYEIEQRNAKSLMNFNKMGGRTGYLSPKYRAY